MAKTQTIEIFPALENDYDRAIQRRDRYILGAVQGQKRPMSRRKRRAFARQTLFEFLAPLWNALTTEEKTTWNNAGVVTQNSGWQLFVSDNAQRLKNDLPLEVPPHMLWQVRTGHIVINSPGDGILLRQQHPLDYWEVVPIRGKRWKSELIQIKEDFSLPLQIGIRVKTNLTATGSEQRARFYAHVVTSYQGKNRDYFLSLDFDPVADWTFLEDSLSGVIGYFVRYDVYIDIFGYTGTCTFDNLIISHSGTNWARDKKCNFVQRTFSGAWSVTFPYWEKIYFPAGVSLDTVYPPAL